MSVEQTPAPVAPVQDPAPQTIPAAPAPTPGAEAPSVVPPAAVPATTAAPTPPALPAPAVAPPAPSGPWAADLNQRFPDPAVQAQVNEYLASTVQPHVTKLEQETAPARELYGAFKADPDKAFAQIAKELYGDEEATAITDYLESLDNEPAAPEPQNQTRTSSRFNLDPDPPTPSRDPEVQALIDAEKARQAKATYDAEFARVQQAEVTRAQAEGRQPLEIDRELFAPFAQRAQTLDNAVENYRAYVAKINAKYAEQPAPGQPAPPTLGNDAAGASAPPTVPQHQTLNEAIDEHFDFVKSDGTPVAPPIP